jgi:hypothetical protein
MIKNVSYNWSCSLLELRKQGARKHPCFYGGTSLHLLASNSLCIFSVHITDVNTITFLFYVYVCRDHLGISWRTHWLVYWVLQTATWRIKMITPLSAQLLSSREGTRALGGEDIGIIITMRHCEGLTLWRSGSSTLVLGPERYLMVR